MTPHRLTSVPNNPFTSASHSARRFSGHRGGRWLLLAVVLFNLFSLPSLADDVTDCSEDGFLGALSFDDQALFTEDCSITLTAPIPITGTNTVIDAQGHNVSISGDNQFLVFEIQQGAHLTISGVTITGGQNTNGGAFFVYDSGVLVLSNCTVVGNQALGTNGVDGADAVQTNNGNGSDGRPGTSGGPAFGGAIFNLGSVTLLNCTVTSNSVSGGDGGNGGKGADTTASLARGGNGGAGGKGGAAFGGAIYHAGNFLMFSNSTFSGNTAVGGNAGTGGEFGTGFSPGLAGSGGSGAQGSGAVVYNTNAFIETTIDLETNTITTNFTIFSTNIVIVQSTFSGNSAQGGNSAAGGTASTGQGVTGARGADSFGGALFLSAGNVTNCTFYNDRASGGAGGDGGTGTANLAHGGNGGNGGNATGAALYHNVGPAELNVVSCTISNCSAFGGTNGAAGTGPFPGTAGTKGASHGSVANGTGTFNLQNTILATNLSGQASFGTVVDAGYNITFGTTFKLISGSGSFKTNDVKLGPLKNNGGLTATMALLAGSPALDRIPTNPPGLFPTNDQRGFIRPINGAADIGAYEFEFAGGPVITQEPTNAVTALNSNATFFVVAIGAPILRYQWYFNGSRITNATRSSFTVTNATPTNAGDYTVIVTNNFGSATSSPPVHVRFSPSITNQPTSQTVAPGGTALFTVGATGEAPLFYQWLFQGTNLVGKTDTTLTINNAHQTNVGNYQVTVTNSLGSVTSAPAALNLQPGILTQPTNINAAAGSTVTFTVLAEGSPPLAYQWQRNGAAAPNGNSSSLVIPNVSASVAGSYNVVITNAFGSITSTNAILTVINGSNAPPLSIATPTVVSNNLNLAFLSQTGFTYVVEYKTNLSSPVWATLLSTNGTGNPVLIQDSTTNSSSRFYRVRVQ